MPDAWGRALTGALWRPASPLLLPLALAAVGQWIVTVAIKGLYARQTVGAAFRVRLLTAGIRLPALAVAVSVAGVQGGAWALCGASIVGASIAWANFLRGERQDRPAPAIPAATTGEIEALQTSGVA
jgi:O-antigen/teichoic acid export membrane protein